MASIDKIKESFEGTGNTDIILKELADGIVIRNKTEALLTFEIGSRNGVISIEVPSQEAFSGYFDDFIKITVISTGAFKGFVTKGEDS